MNLNEVVIETKRLKLIPINDSHLMPIYKHFTISISKYMFPQPSGNIGDTENFIKTSMEGLADGTNLQLVIHDIETNKFLGCVGLHHVGTEDPELGVWIRKSYHSQGLGMEAIRGIIKWAKENIEYDHLKYPVDKNNRSSRRIPMSCGGKFVKSYSMLNMNETKKLDVVEYWIK
jgi:RimJ/RimL family protein N-acetyltransferase